MDDHELRICSSCVGEAYLAAKIERTGRSATCNYCEERSACVTIEELADDVERAFDHHFVRTSTEPDGWERALIADRESNYEWSRDGYPVLEAIQDAAAIDEGPAQDVLRLLSERNSDFDSAAMGEETEFAVDSHYAPRSASSRTWQAEWRQFESSLKTEARFFNQTAADLLSRVFADIDNLQSARGKPLIVKAGLKGRFSSLYRARVFQSEDALRDALGRPDKGMGSPPARLASAGRMNARGVSVFYGATSPAVALAEVRPPAGARVVVARFKVLRPLRLLDLTALAGVRDGGSIFDPTLKSRLERVAFLRTLGDLISRPVMPDDEAFDYLPTQAIADFLATELQPSFDGIVFRSAQSGVGSNVVLFHKASKVQALELPDAAKVSVYTGMTTEDGWEFDYSVHTLVPRAGPEIGRQADGIDFLPLPYPGPKPDPDLSWDPREAALMVDTACIRVHHVQSVKIRAIGFDVFRAAAREDVQDF